MQKKVGRIAGSIAAAGMLVGMAMGAVQGMDELSLPGRAWRARTSEQPAPEAIRRILTAQQAAWNRGDIAAFLEGYWDSPELTFSGSQGIVRGYESLLERYRKNYPDRAAMGELEFSGLEVRVLGPDAALVLGHWHLKRSSGDVGGVFTLVFRRFAVGWRIVHDHTSVSTQK